MANNNKFATLGITAAVAIVAIVGVISLTQGQTTKTTLPVNTQTQQAQNSNQAGQAFDRVCQRECKEYGKKCRTLPYEGSNQTQCSTYCKEYEMNCERTPPTTGGTREAPSNLAGKVTTGGSTSGGAMEAPCIKENSCDHVGWLSGTFDKDHIYECSTNYGEKQYYMDERRNPESIYNTC